jgi:molybdopterin molybdotransferase
MKRNAISEREFEMLTAGYLLAGGKNRRMHGEKKLFLEYEGKHFYEWIAEAFSGFSKIYLSVDRADAFETLGMPMVVDRYPKTGPIGGICSGLEQCAEDALFVTACDTPLIDRESVKKIFAAYLACPGRVTVAGCGERIHPLFGIYPKAALPVLQQMIAEGNYRMHEVLERTDAAIVDLGPDGRVLKNVNTPEDYAGLPGRPFFFAISGYKNTGKTTLITRLLPELEKLGCKVAVIKHDGHDFESDVPGTDSWRHQQAGAYATAVFSQNRFLMTKTCENINEMQIARAFPEADIILLEGFKNSAYHKYICNYPAEDLIDAGELAKQIRDLAYGCGSGNCEKRQEKEENRKIEETRKIEENRKMLTLEEAQERLKSKVQEIADVETVPLWEAGRRVLAEDVSATYRQPPFDRSAMDGYAVSSVDTAGAERERPVKLRVIDEVCAGHVTEREITPGTAVRIMTGAPIPKGADCVIRQEDTDYGETEVCIYHAGKRYENYCFAGEDYEQGECLLRAGCVLGAVEIGILASLGRECVQVRRRPRVAVISTGDEIIAPGEPLRPGKIYDSNLYTVVTQLESYGAEVPCRECAADDAAYVAGRIAAVADDVDLIVTTGGVSVGKMDIMHEVLRLLKAEPLFWKIAVKPGMPTLAAFWKNRLLICLSGNPYGAFVNTELLIRPAIGKLAMRPELEIRRAKAILLDSYRKKSPVTRYLRACCQGHQVRLSDGSNDSGIFSSLHGCNCLIEIPAGTPEVLAGEEVEIIFLF